MGKLIYGFNVSVDGYIADAQGNIDWSEPSDELHQYWNDFARETALSFYGRRLYDLMSAYWPTAEQAPDATPLIVDFARIWCAMPKVVFSRSLESGAVGPRVAQSRRASSMRCTFAVSCPR
ncbi:dihydrofolate reductase [Mycolicibacterium canariasense]|uniref:Dihydrofolate reductase n=1 Tax=Mycolicibacterium canariasense TaxID=228230 RepID=A0A100WHR2_MYCCR|nr:dihydrofolate reductase [Mycolicibacterium canariasense]